MGDNTTNPTGQEQGGPTGFQRGKNKAGPTGFRRGKNKAAPPEIPMGPPDSRLGSLRLCGCDYHTVFVHRS